MCPPKIKQQPAPTVNVESPAPAPAQATPGADQIKIGAGDDPANKKKIGLARLRLGKSA